MGRKSKLSEEQWAELFRRVSEGESRRALGEEFGLSEASIRQREAKIGKTAEVQQVARMIVETQAAYESLPPIGQINSQKLAQRLMSITGSMAAGAEMSAMNFHRLSALANAELQKVDDANVLGSEGALKVVAVLTKMANDAAVTPINLLSANKDRIKAEDDPDNTLGPELTDVQLARIATASSR